MLVLTILVSITALCSSTIVFPAIQNSQSNDVEAGLILIQGALIDAKYYSKFSLELQKKFNGKLWVAIAEFPLSTPQPIQMSSKINQAITDLKKAGFNIKQDTQIFFAGHSLGGTMVQDYVLDKVSDQSIPYKIAGLILEGSYITRKNFGKVDSNLPVLTLGAELDGLNRITRMAESFYWDTKDQEKTQSFKRVTLIIPGINHYQFSGEGEPPFLVRQNDIKAELDDNEAKNKIVSIISAFIAVALEKASDEDKNLLEQYFDVSHKLLDPINEAFLMEGSYHFKPPCSSLKDPKGIDCWEGSPWTEAYTQKIMGGSQVSLVVTDEFHPVYQINPVHLPAIHNNCSEPFKCILNVTTVSENIYSNTDSFDVSLEPIAATEIKTKLMSRQAILKSATGKVYDFNETDGGNICKDINNESLKWAMERTPNATLERYNKIGKKLVPGPDKGPYNIGPLWIWMYLSYDDKVDPQTKENYTQLSSPMMKVDVNYFIPAARGFHYCKVLSPARAIEWIYVDSLKP